MYSKHVIDLTIHLHNGNGNYVDIPDLGVPKEILKAIRLGWHANDASCNYDNPAMGTHYVWQTLSWLILHPRR